MIVWLLLTVQVQQHHATHGLTVDDADLAALVLCAQRDRVGLLGRHDAHRAQAVSALDVGVIVGVVLRQDVLCAAGV